MPFAINIAVICFRFWEVWQLSKLQLFYNNKQAIHVYSVSYLKKIGSGIGKAIGCCYTHRNLPAQISCNILQISCIGSMHSAVDYCVAATRA